jgi:hypothetical protein
LDLCGKVLFRQLCEKKPDAIDALREVFRFYGQKRFKHDVTALAGKALWRAVETGPLPQAAKALQHLLVSRSSFRYPLASS